MTTGQAFPNIRVNTPDGLTNDYKFRWYYNSNNSFSELTDINRLRGDNLIEDDLINETNVGEYESIPGVYSYHVGVNTNINRDSDFAGCESLEKQRVDIVVYPNAETVGLELDNIATRQSDNNSQLESDENFK